MRFFKNASLVLLFLFLSITVNAQNWDAEYNALDGTPTNLKTVIASKPATLIMLSPAYFPGPMYKRIKKSEQKSDLEKYLEKYNVQQLYFVFTRDEEKTRQKIQRILKGAEPAYPVFFDEEVKVKEKVISGAKYGDARFTAFPYAYLVDSKGKILAEGTYSSFNGKNDPFAASLAEAGSIPNPAESRSDAFQQAPTQVIHLEGDRVFVAGSRLKASWLNYEHQYAYWNGQNWEIPTAAFDKAPTQFFKSSDGKLLAIGKYTRLINPESKAKISDASGAMVWEKETWVPFSTPVKGYEKRFFNGQDDKLYLAGGKTETQLYVYESGQWKNLNLNRQNADIKQLITLADGSIYLYGNFSIYKNQTEQMQAMMSPEIAGNLVARLNAQSNQASLIKWDGQEWINVWYQFNQIDDNIFMTKMHGLILSPDQRIVGIASMIDYKDQASIKTATVKAYAFDDSGTPSELDDPPFKGVQVHDDIAVLDDQAGHFYLTGKRSEDMYGLARFDGQSWQLISDAIEGGAIKAISLDATNQQLYITGAYRKIGTQKGHLIALPLVPKD